MSGLWLIYRRRSRSVEEEAGVSDQYQLDAGKALVEQLEPGGAYEVIDDLGGTRSGRGTKNRTGWQEVIRRVEEGGIAGVVAKDVSRLARNARLVRDLRDACEKQGTLLRVAEMPTIDPTNTTGRFMWGMMAEVAEMYSNMLSDTMKATAKTTYEAGGLWATTPFGYRTVYRENGDVEHVDRKARVLEQVPEEAEIVRRVFADMARLPFRDISDALNREGVRRRGKVWTINAIKDLWRRREVYRGNVTSHRHAEARPGAHDRIRILSDDEFSEAVAGVLRRTHHKGRRPSTSKRLYLLRGLVFCGHCGARMHGDARVARGQAWRYYLCPTAERKLARLDEDGKLVECRALRVPATAAERLVLAKLKELMVPDEAMAAAEAELRRRLRQPKPGTADRERERLETRLRKLADLYGWGDLAEPDYRRQVSDVRSQLALLPSDSGKIVAFEKYRAGVRAFAELVDVASGDKLQELVPLLVEKVWTFDRHVTEVVPTEPARPFFRWADPENAEDSLRGVWRPSLLYLRWNP